MCLCVCVCVYVFVYMCLCICVCVYVFVYMCLCICVCVCVWKDNIGAIHSRPSLPPTCLLLTAYNPFLINAPSPWRWMCLAWRQAGRSAPRALGWRAHTRVPRRDCCARACRTRWGGMQIIKFNFQNKFYTSNIQCAFSFVFFMMWRAITVASHFRRPPQSGTCSRRCWTPMYLAAKQGHCGCVWPHLNFIEIHHHVQHIILHNGCVIIIILFFYFYNSNWLSSFSLSLLSSSLNTI